MTVIYIWIGLLLIASGWFAKNYYNANQRQKQLDRKRQEHIRRMQDRVYYKKVK
jgi:hypothetical protein